MRWAARYQNVNASEIDLIGGLKNEGDWARSLIAKHPNLRDSRVLEGLVTDQSWWVRAALAENKNLPSAVRKILMGDTDERVKRTAEANRGE